ncbi:hypothetical protein, partial [Peterkaempfera griseoplana]|uniref:hypothetical protein n=1 Tax=Peterkaempfera griseoplana TaxID=66896 RepID=UPI0006E40CE4
MVLSHVPLRGGEDGPYAALVAADQSAVWGPPGQADTLAVHIRFGIPEERLFTLDLTRTYSIALAERWLVHTHRVDPRDFVRSPGTVRPADAATREIEERTRTSGDRYQLLDAALNHTTLTCAILLKDTKSGTTLPYLVQVQWPDDGTGYHITETPFRDEYSARRWMEHTEPPQDTDCLSPTVDRATAAALPRAPTAAPSPPGAPV